MWCVLLVCCGVLNEMFCVVCGVGVVVLVGICCCVVCGCGEKLN